MAVYIGGNKYKLIFKGNVCRPQTDTYIPIINKYKLLSSDNCILKDKNDIYLITKKEDE